MTDWIIRLIEDMGYIGIAMLMFLENLFPPLPSEVIMPMAGFSAVNGRLSIVSVLLAGTIGTLAGALFWYTVAQKLGEDGFKRWVTRHGRWVTLSAQDIDKIDRWFDKHGNWAIPLAHLVPGVRSLVSIPAGIFGMSLARFAVLTATGAGIWTSGLGLAGYVLGRQFDQVGHYLGPVGTGIIAVLVAWYLYRVATFTR